MVFFSILVFHHGNTVRDTRGCILVGYNDSVGMLFNSRDAYMSLASNILETIKRHDVVLLHIHEVVENDHLNLIK